MSLIVSIDVEDWFHIMDIDAAPPLSRWLHMPSRVEHNFHRLLDLFEGSGVRTTCFVLGWIAERYPQLVREAVRRGHEIASHSYAHQLIYNMTPAAFAADTRHARCLLQDVSGQPVLGYRAPGFSVTQATPWFFEVLSECGHTYDTSLFPARRGHGGLPSAPRAPFIVRTDSGRIIEVPVSVTEIGSIRMCLFGGGYFRLIPYAPFRFIARRLVARQMPLIFYLHPRDIDPEQPRLPMPLERRFKSYVGLAQTFDKVSRMLNDFQATSFENYLHSRLAIEADADPLPYYCVFR